MTATQPPNQMVLLSLNLKKDNKKNPKVNAALTVKTVAKPPHPHHFFSKYSSIR